jgi:hypothetical protein
MSEALQIISVILSAALLGLGALMMYLVRNMQSQINESFSRQHELEVVVHRDCIKKMDLESIVTGVVRGLR